jgi:hypothetical protein
MRRYYYTAEFYVHVTNAIVEVTGGYLDVADGESVSEDALAERVRTKIVNAFSVIENPSDVRIVIDPDWDEL